MLSVNLIRNLLVASLFAGATFIPATHATYVTFPPGANPPLAGGTSGHIIDLLTSHYVTVTEVYAKTKPLSESSMNVDAQHNPAREALAESFMIACMDGNHPEAGQNPIYVTIGNFCKYQLSIPQIVSAEAAKGNHRVGRRGERIGKKTFLQDMKGLKAAARTFESQRAAYGPNRPSKMDLVNLIVLAIERHQALTNKYLGQSRAKPWMILRILRESEVVIRNMIEPDGFDSRTLAMYASPLAWLSLDAATGMPTMNTQSSEDLTPEIETEMACRFVLHPRHYETVKLFLSSGAVEAHCHHILYGAPRLPKNSFPEENFIVEKLGEKFTASYPPKGPLILPLATKKADWDRITKTIKQLRTLRDLLLGIEEKDPMYPASRLALVKVFMEGIRHFNTMKNSNPLDRRGARDTMLLAGASILTVSHDASFPSEPLPTNLREYLSSADVDPRRGSLDRNFDLASKRLPKDLVYATEPAADANPGNYIQIFPGFRARNKRVNLAEGDSRPSKVPRWSPSPNRHA